MAVSFRPEGNLDARGAESVVERSRELVRCGPGAAGLAMQPLDDGPHKLAEGREIEVHTRPLAILIHSCRQHGSASGGTLERFDQSLRQWT